MRINKKILEGRVTKRLFKKDYWDSESYKVDMKPLANFLAGSLAIGLSIWFVVWVFLGLQHQTQTDERKWNHICDIMAQGKPHYITKSPAAGVAEACAIGPDWHQVNI